MVQIVSVGCYGRTGRELIAGTAQHQQKQPKDKSFLARKKILYVIMDSQERTFLNLEHLH